MALTFSTSEVMEWLSNHSKDDIWGGLGSLRLYMAVQHKELINQALLNDVESDAGAAAADYTGTNDFESLDRIISSDAEEDTLGGTYANIYNPWETTTSQIDRNAGTDFDATVDSAGGAIGTNGVLTDDVLRTHLRKIRIAAGKEPNVSLDSHEI